MNQVAFILNNTTVYWYSVILALSVLTGICLFMGICLYAGIRPLWAAGGALMAVVLSLPLSRLVYWYCRADSFQSLSQALTTPSSESFALAGAFFGCGLSALLAGKASGKGWAMTDAMSLAGCGAIALGRMGNLFTAADRGQIVTEMTNLPWAYPVVNATAGTPEYRLATFCFQAIVAAALFVALAVVFFSGRTRKGGVTVLFFMIYGASQVLLDSTRYDSLYLRSNGFVSMVQVLSAVALVAGLVIVSVGAVRELGLKKRLIAAWTVIACLLGLAGYMEYFVQRHGKLAFFAYTVMEHSLVGILVLGVLLWRTAMRNPEK